MPLPLEIAASYLAGEFRYFRTAKGYLTAESMDYWIDGVLLRYFAGVRAPIESHFPVFLLLDGFQAHFTPHARDAFARDDVIVIPIRVHKSHLSQLLNLCVFGIVKKE
jgi:hypothetical protein